MQAKVLKWFLLIVAVGLIAWWGHAAINKFFENELIEQANVIDSSQRAAISQVEAKASKAEAKSLERQTIEDNDRVKTLQAQLASSRAEVRKLEGTLAKHDLGMLMRQRPQQVINRINAGTDRVFDEFKTINDDLTEQKDTVNANQ